MKKEERREEEERVVLGGLMDHDDYLRHFFLGWREEWKETEVGREEVRGIAGRAGGKSGLGWGAEEGGVGCREGERIYRFVFEEKQRRGKMGPLRRRNS